MVLIRVGYQVVMMSLTVTRELEPILSKKHLATISETAHMEGHVFDSLSYIEAMKCLVLEEDKHKFQHPLPFGREPTSIRVSKKNTLFSDSGLKFVVSGPGEAGVTVHDECEGVERCDISPSKPGRYRLEVFWRETHIRGSPFSLVFTLPSKRLFRSGLDLHCVKYRLGIEHKFKLDFSDLGELEGDDNLQVTISPPTAATIQVSEPAEKPNSYHCRIFPLQVGRHEIAVMNSGEHICGSPFKVEFGLPGDASRCLLSTSSKLHRVGNKISFTVDTKEAGYGQLRAGVKDVTNNKPIDLLVSRTHRDEYTLDFDPGSSQECSLTVKYDNAHIKGSPFRLLFNDLACCTTEGAGLVSAQAGTWNLFSVKAKCKCQGALKVDVHKSDGERVETVVSARSSLHFDVAYHPKSPGEYTVSLQWGEAQVPGSPFQVSCHSASLAVTDRPASDVTLGSAINFRVQPFASERDMKSVGVLHVSARDSTGKETIGEAVWDNGKNCYSCSLSPDRAGKYPISVKLNHAHVMGSPFVVTVIDPPSPHLVKVWGSGLAGTTVDQDGHFTVDVSEAGTGLLTVGIRDEQDAVKIHTSRNSSNGLIKVSYHSPLPGSFLMDVSWSGTPIPLSPFTVTVSSKNSDKKEELRTLDKHELFLGNVTSVGINGDWLKVWRSSTRLKRKHSSAARHVRKARQGVELEEALISLI